MNKAEHRNPSRSVGGMLRAVVGAALCVASAASAQVAVKAGTLHTMEGEPITDALVLIGEDGQIDYVGKASERAIPAGYTTHECAVATPGLVDVRSTLGFTGLYNVDADQDQLDDSARLQPGLRAIDAYNPRDRLIGYSRSFGVTTVHTGHGPGELISGQTMIAKTRGDTVEDAVFVPAKAVAATLGPRAHKGGGKSPGSRAKAMEMLRTELLKAQAHAAKIARAESDPDTEGPSRDLAMESLVSVLNRETPLIIAADRAQDIANAMRLADEFGFTLWLESAAESYLLADQLKERGTPVLLHPTMARSWGERANLSYNTAKILSDAGVPFAIESGYEGYVPKVRIVLFEAAAAAGYGELGFGDALAAVTIEAAKILGVDGRVGSIAVGKDGDIAMYNADPFEYTTHCVGVLIEGDHFAGEREFDIGYP